LSGNRFHPNSCDMSKNSRTKPDILKSLSSPQKALKTATWARTMTKVAITLSRKGGVKWILVEFGGSTGAESRGIVDILAIRKNHEEVTGFKRGDTFGLVLIQTKGGTASWPSQSDIDRLLAVKKYHRAEEIVLAEWKKGKKANLYRLNGQASKKGPARTRRQAWTPVEPEVIFG
jgi:hypothetical protein